MKQILGILLVALGIIALAYGGITYTKQEHVADIGPIHATAEKTHTVPFSPIVGAAALIGGVVLLVNSRRA